MNKVYLENSKGSYACIPVSGSNISATDYLTFSAPEGDDAPNRYYLQMQQELAGNVEFDGVPVVASINAYAGSDREAADLAAQAEGTERNWRDVELSNADIEIYKLEDSSGDTTAWRAYRQTLRDYPQQSNFPDGTRPTSPGV
jgi:hypothetical protein